MRITNFSGMCLRMVTAQGYAANLCRTRLLTPATDTGRLARPRNIPRKRTCSNCYP